MKAYKLAGSYCSITPSLIKAGIIGTNYLYRYSTGLVWQFNGCTTGRQGSNAIRQVTQAYCYNRIIYKMQSQDIFCTSKSDTQLLGFLSLVGLLLDETAEGQSSALEDLLT